MWRAPSIIGTVLSLSALAGAVCPIVIVSGSGEPDGIVLTFRNSAKLPIRRLEFDCQSAESRRGSGVCRETNALFYPGMEYTVRYPYPGGHSASVTVAVKSVTSSDGFVWKPSKRQPCRTLRIVPRPRKATR